MGRDSCRAIISRAITMTVMACSMGTVRCYGVTVILFLLLAQLVWRLYSGY